MIGKLCAKYQLCAIRTADNTDGKSRKSIVSEKSPSFRPAHYLPSINSARYTQQIIQTVKSRLTAECPPMPIVSEKGPSFRPSPRLSLTQSGAGLNDGLFSETMDFRDFPSVLSVVRITQS